MDSITSAVEAATSFDAAFSALGDGLSSVTAPASEPEASPAPASTETTADPAAPAVDAAASKPGDAEPAQTHEDDEDFDPTEVPKPDNFRDNRWKNIQSAYARERDLWTKPHEALNGLTLAEAVGVNPRIDGPEKVIQAIKEQADAGAYLEQLNGDLQVGSPEATGRFIEKHVAKYFPQALPGIAAKAIEMLQNPNLPANIRAQADTQLKAISDRAMGPVIDRMYSEATRAAQAGDKGAVQLLYAAQRLEYETRGTYRNLDQIAAPAQVNPELEDAKKIIAQAASIREQGVKQEIEGWQRSTNQQIETGVVKVVKDALAPVLNVQTDKPALFKSVLDSLRANAEEMVKKDHNWMAKWFAQVRAANEARSPEAADALATMWTQKVGQVADRIKRSYIAELSGTVAQENKDSHARHETAAARREPGGAAGQPQQPNTIADKIRGAKSFDEAFSFATGR